MKRIIIITILTSVLCLQLFLPNPSNAVAENNQLTSADETENNLQNDYEEEIKGIHPLDLYHGKANELLYINNNLYPKGFIKSITTVLAGEGSASIFLINPNEKSIFRKYTVSGDGIVNIDVNEYIDIDFYIGIQGPVRYLGSAYDEININFATVKASDINPGEILNFTFNDRKPNDKIYILAHEITYTFPNINTNEDNSTSLNSDIVVHNDKVKTRNKMFACGDSITAGHPSYIEGGHWWEDVGRDLDFEVTAGARNGSGVSYYNGMNACVIVNNTDFSDYNLAVFAFGTNDYGNNIPIGTIDDQYTYSEDSSQTFYASLKYVVETAKTKNPEMTVIWSLPINRTCVNGETAGNIDTQWAYGTPNLVGSTLNDYCEAIVNVCNKYGISYIDHRNGAFDVFALDNLLVDGLHPSETGYEILGQEMSAHISSLFRPYVEYNGVGGIDKW